MYAMNVTTCEAAQGWDTPAGGMMILTAVTALIHAVITVFLKRKSILDVFRSEPQSGTSVLRKDLGALHARVSDVGKFLTQIEARLPPSPVGGSPDRSDAMV